jgi:long-chain acyl-CoA synthetase
MASSLKKKLIRVLPDHTEICIMYGAAEASARLTYLEPDQLENKINSIGKPIPGVKIKTGVSWIR